MNNIYKVIWSKVANALVVVSELARSKWVSGRNSVAASSNTVKVRTKLTALSVALSFCFGASSVFAADINEANVTATTSLTVGANNIGTTTLHGTATLNGKNLATVADLVTKAEKSALDTLTTTVGTKANQSDLDTLTTTVNTKANQGDLTDLKGTVDKLGIQTTYNGIKYFRANSTGVDAIATGVDAVAVGPASQATAVNTVAVGHESKALKDAAVAVGRKSYANSNDGIAVGNSAAVTAGGKYAIALGSQAQAGSKSNIEGGEQTYDGATTYLTGDGNSAIAIGNKAVSRGQQNIAIGKEALTTNKDKANTFSFDSIAIGTNAETIAASSAIALGKGARAGVRDQNAGADSAIAMGENAQATGLDATAIGHSGQAGKLGLAAGKSAQATGEDSVALGSEAQSTSKASVAIGNRAIAAPYRTISIGQDAGKGQAADPVGDKNEQINIGVRAGENVDGQLNIGIGQAAGSNVQGKGNIALGQNAGQYIGGTNSSVGNNISIGTNANTYTTATDITESVAIGFGAKAKTRSVALGKETKATELDSVAIGNNATSNGSGSLAIGNDSVVNGADNIALGRSSVADTKAASGYLTSKQSSTVVSVGKSDLLRRIVNVADGADDQDAATVAQLKKVSDEVYNKVNTQIKNLSITATSGINYDAAPEDTTKNSVTLSKDGKKTLIRSVAEGTKDDDAVNVSQLKKTVEENKTHYFSTNDGGTTRGNFNNNGAVGNGSLAIGMEVKSLAERGVSLGNHASAEGVGSIAIGTLYDGSAALDDNEAQNAIQTTAKSSTGQPFKYNMAIGAGASSEGNNSLAIGTLATTTTKQQNNSTPDRAVALGYFAKSSAPKANAIGERATASEEKANAFGSQATAAGISATAIGTAAFAEGKNSIAMGTHQRVTGENSGSIGYAGDATLSPTGRTLNGTYVDIATKVKGAGTYSIGNTNSEITSNESGVFGNNNFVQGKENIRVMGNNNIITKNNQNGGAAVGATLKNVYVTGHANKIDTGAKPLEESKNIFVMGAGNTIGNSQNNTTASKIRDSYVIGTGNTINNPNRTLEGSAGNPTFGDDPSDPSTTKSKIGRGYFILGNNVTATLDDSVYLGTNSAYVSDADRSARTQYNRPTDAYEALLFEKYTGHWSTGVVTVGSVSSPRRIQGVAAGLVGPKSMDAINGSQLYAHTRPVGFVADNTEGLTGKDLDKLVVDEQGITNMVKRSAGQAIKLEGGADKTKLSDNNIGTLVKGTNQVDIKLAKELKGLTSAEFKDGTNTTIINGKGVTINTNGPSMTTDGIHAGNLKVTGVASSIADQVINNNPNPTFIDKLNQANNTNPNNAVNVSDLHNVLSGANGGFGLKDKAGNEFKQDLGTTAQITGDKNINTKVVDVLDAQGQPTGKKALEVGLNPEVELGKKGNDGVDGKLTVNGKDGSAVVINGKDGSIGLNGKDGANGLTIKSAKGEKGLDGNDGQDGKTRIVYEKPNGSKEEVATLNDGLVFTGNNNTVLNKHKLNTTVNVVGDSSTAELANFASATGNLNVVADGNNKLTVQMNKNLKNLNSVTMVNETDPDKSVKLNVTDKGELNVGGDKADGNQVTGVKSSISDKLGAGDKFADKLNKAATDNPTNAVNVSDLKQTRDSITTSDLGGGFGLKDQDDAEVKQDLGTTVKVKGDANVYTKVVTDGTGKALEVGLKDTVTLGKAGTDGKDGKIGVNGKDGSAVVINGKDGSIGLNGKDGKDGLTMKSAQGKPGVDGKDGETKTRIVYELKDKDGNPVKDADGKVVKEEVATLNDGLKFGANSGNVHNAKLNSQVNVKGAETNKEWGKFDGGKNIMTNIAGNTITVGLAKDLDVNSVTTGDTKVENSGITIKNGSEQSKTVSLTKTGLNNGGNQVVNMDSGLKDSQGNKVTLTEATGDVLNNGVNVGDLKETVNKLIGPSDIGGFGLKDKAGNEFKQSLGTTAQITGDKNINTKVVDVLDAQGQATGKKALEVGLNPEVELGKKGNDGVDGKLTVNGKDGSSVVVDGSNGSIGLNGKDGKDGLTMKSEVGEAGLDQNNATDPNKPDDKGSKTRLVYEHVLKDKDGNPQKGQDGKPVTVKEQVATLNDGLVFAGNNTDKENKHKLNSKVNIVGDSTAEQLKDFKSATGNLNVVADGNNKLTVQMSKNLKNLNSVTLENPTDAKKSVTLTVTDKGELNVGGDKAEGNQVTGVKSSITDKAGATFADKLKNAADKDNGNPNNAVNVGDLYNVFSGESGGGFGLKDKAGNEFKQDLGTTAQITGDKNINTKVVDVLDAQGQATGKKALEVGLNPEIELGEKAVPGVNGQPGKPGVDGKIGVNGKDGSAVVINGKDGSIGLNGKDGKDGLTMKSAQGKPGVDGKDGETKTRIVYETKDKDGKPVTEEVATLNDGLKFGDNSGNVHNAKLNSQVNVKGAETNKDWGKFDGGKNIMTQIKGNTITVGLANDINVNSVTTNKVTVGDTTITTDGVTINNGPSMTKSGGINANNTTIKNVAPGVNSTDAVNVSQLRAVEGKLNRADKHLRAGIAGANAAAGLPQAYLPGKSMVAVSAGTYRGEGAVALGMSRISDNGKVVVKITGNSDTRGNLGASLGAGYQW